MIVRGELPPKHQASGDRSNIVRALVKRLEGGMIWEPNSIGNCDLFIQWGLPRRDENWQAKVKEGMVSICLDRGYFDDTRFKKFSISVQGVHGLSMPLPTVLDLPPRDHPILQPWRPEPGEFVQIIAPGWSPGYWRTPAKRLPEGWVSETARNASQKFDIPAKIRYHPRALPPNLRQSQPLASSLEETHVSVTYMSLTSVQTIIAGIPTVVMHPRAPAFSMGCSHMGIVRPDREAWIHDLSHREYYMNDEKELDAAAEYIIAAYAAAKKAGPLTSPLLRYGIKGEKV